MTKDNAKISVICILYHSKHLIAALLINLTEKFEERLGEVILINNSIDEDLEIYNNGKVKVITPDRNLGYGGGLNLGVKEAHFDLLLLINPDIIITHSSLEITSEDRIIAGGFNEEFPIGHYFPSIFRDTFRMSFRNIFPFHFLDFLIDVPHVKITKHKQYVDYFSGSLIITNKESYKQINGFDSKFFLFYEEIDLCRRAKKAGLEVYITKDISYLHSIHTSASKKDVLELKIFSELDSFYNYHQKYQGRLTYLSWSFLQVFTILFYPIITLLSIICPHTYLKKRKAILQIYFKYFFTTDRLK
jgi:N-acetylglucosaminyl-diphospho-decaprenol L-rhamnosyltransferase